MHPQAPTLGAARPRSLSETPGTYLRAMAQASRTDSEFVQPLEGDRELERMIRKAKLHIDVQLGEDDDPSHLIAASDFRIDTTPAGSIGLVFTIAPSLRTSRRQAAMHHQAHVWAQSAGALRSIEIPNLVEDLRDAQEEKCDVQWYLRIEMPGYGAFSYRARPIFGAGQVTFDVDELIPD